MGIQTAPAYSLLCANLITNAPLDPLLHAVSAEDFLPRKG